MTPALIPHLMMATFVLPVDLEKWSATPVKEDVPVPLFEKKPREWRVSTQNNAGGYAILLPEPFGGVPESLLARWSWRALRFPKTTPKVPFTKKQDDYALRVGFLLTDGTSKIPLPGKFGEALKKRGLFLSYIVFYGAVQQVIVPDPKKEKKNFLGLSLPFGNSKLLNPLCGASPYTSNIINCVRVASSSSKTVEVFPVLDLLQNHYVSEMRRDRIRIIGVWIFADSDASGSASVAFLSDLKLLKR